MHIDYKSPLVREIRDRQRQAATREQLLQRIEAAERLMATVDDGQTYQPTQVFEHLAGAEETPAEASRKIAGRDLVHDLRLLVDRTLSRLYRSEGFRSVYARYFGMPDANTEVFFRFVAVPE